jgi:hypothetical protein
MHHYHQPLLLQALLQTLLLLCSDHLQQLWNALQWQQLLGPQQVSHHQQLQQQQHQGLLHQLCLPVWPLLWAALLVQVD